MAGVALVVLLLGVFFLISSGTASFWKSLESNSDESFEPRHVPSSRSSNPAWSPDGRSIGYVNITIAGREIISGIPDLERSICLMDSEGQNKRKLLDAGSGFFLSDTLAFDWLPNGILVFEQHDGLSAVGLGGTTRGIATRGSSPAVSPDGTQVAYVLADGVHVAALDGSAERFIAAGDQPAWSRDGSRLAFVSTPEGAIYAVNVDGTGLSRVALGNRGLDWSPDGTRIAFTRTWSPGIVAANVDGSGEVQLTTGDDSEPDWSPDGTRIAFERADNIYVQTLGESEAKRYTSGYGACGSAT